MHSFEKTTRARIALALAAALALGALSACGAKEPAADGSAASQDAPTVIKVGASPTPHAEILEQVKEALAEEGYELEIVEYTDYVLPNTDLQAGELDANYFQHVPYLEDFNEENGTDIVSAAGIHFEPLGIYSGKTKSLDAIADGAKIAVPNDATNEARALLLLESEGVITLKDGVGLEATVNDIAENPSNIEFVEVEAAAAPATLAEVDFVVINGNYALSAGLTADDVVAAEDPDSLAAETYANIVAVKAGSENDPRVRALIKALTSDAVRAFIEQEYAGAVVTVF